MNRCRFSRFSSDDSFPNNPCVGEIAFDPIAEKGFIYTGKRWVDIRELTSQPCIPIRRIHSGTCPRCGALCSPYQERCDYCNGYFEF